MSDETIEKAFREAGVTDRITCTQAFGLSKTYGIPVREIGNYCNSHAIKIRGCQLGCFE